MSEIRNEYFPLKDETDAIIHLGFEIHKILGFGFLEIVYKETRLLKIYRYCSGVYRGHFRASVAIKASNYES